MIKSDTNNTPDTTDDTSAAWITLLTILPTHVSDALVRGSTPVHIEAERVSIHQQGEKRWQPTVPEHHDT